MSLSLLAWPSSLLLKVHSLDATRSRHCALPVERLPHFRSNTRIFGPLPDTSSPSN